MPRSVLFFVFGCLTCIERCADAIRSSHSQTMSQKIVKIAPTLSKQTQPNPTQPNQANTSSCRHVKSTGSSNNNNHNNRETSLRFGRQDVAGQQRSQAHFAPKGRPHHTELTGGGGCRCRCPAQPSRQQRRSLQRSPRCRSGCGASRVAAAAQWRR